MPDADDHDSRSGRIDGEDAVDLAAAGGSDGPIWMITLMRGSDRAGDARDADGGGIPASDRDALPGAATAVGGELVFAGDVERQLLGDPPAWDRVAVVKYPSGSALIDVQSSPEFRPPDDHPRADTERTIVIGARPIDLPGVNDTSARWDEVPHPPTDDDPPVVVIHVLAYRGSHRGATPADMAAYQEAARSVATTNGVRVDGWFAAEGTFCGDGRRWDQVRFNAFPSAAAFMAVVADPARLEAQQHHREVAIADTYALLVRPTVNRLADSLTEEAVHG